MNRGIGPEQKAMRSLPAQAAPAPPPIHVVCPPAGWTLPDLRVFWEYREVLYFLVWRDLKIRYKQTVLGVTWILIQPLVTVLIFTVIFGWLAKMPSEGIPYPVFAYAALLPWNFFAAAIDRSGNSLVNNQQFITKIYFPRLLIPVAAILAGIPDILISFVVFIGLMLCFGLTPTVSIVLLPLFLLLATGTALGVGLWLSALNVRYRDIKYLLPFLVQIWMYASPVVYSVDLIPERWRWLLGINPMAGVIDGFRWALLGRAQALSDLTWISIAVAAILLLSGILYFQQTEDTFADLI